ncbi:MAG: glucokinase [Gammaproteobacteria bacterium]
MSARVLAVDVGGTHTRAAIAEVAGSQCQCQCQILRQQRYPSAEFPGLLPILQAFLSAGPEQPTRGSIAVAGPISADGQQARLTNLPWTVDGAALRETLGLDRLTLINDFAAVAHGIAALGPDDLETLQPGEPQAQAPRAVLGAGTGLGQALLAWTPAGYTVLATEGSHVDFAPQNDEQARLLRALQRDYGHVSYERLVSGPGLEFIYRFLRERRGGPLPEAIARAFQAGQAAPAISQAALEGTDRLAVQALDEFVAIFGAQAGNLALNSLPFGGLYLAGGIAPKILLKLRDGGFLAAFNAKGRMQPVTRRVPVQVITHPDPGLLGAAVHAAGD